MRSNSEHERKNSWYSSSLQNPITCSTPARLIPAPIEEHHLASGGEMRNVTLEVPLGLLPLGRRSEGDHATDAWIEALGDALDGTALAGGVASFENNDDAEPLVLDPLLELYQLDLKICQRLV